MEVECEMDAQDRHCLSSILFAAGYRGSKLEAEISRRATIDPTTGSVVGLDLTYCDFQELHSAIGYLLGLQSLDMTYCKRITSLPKEVGRLTQLKRLDLYCCSNLQSLPVEMGQLASTLEHLDLFGCTAMKVPPKEVRSVKAVLPFLSSLLRLRDLQKDTKSNSATNKHRQSNEVASVISCLRSDPRLLRVAAQDAPYAGSLARVVEADKGLVALPLAPTLSGGGHGNPGNSRAETLLDVACSECRAAIESVLYFYRRYRFVCPAGATKGEDVDAPRPAHESDTALVFFASDHGPSLSASPGEAQAPVPVVMKFFHNKQDFLAERNARISQPSNGAHRFFRDYVIPSIRFHDGDVDENFHYAADALNLPRYCLVMERGDRNLMENMFFERHLSGDVEEARYVLYHLAKATLHLHHRGYIHGKINPRNVVRSPSRGGKYCWRLVDLSSSVPIGNALLANMIKSAHSPPEVVSSIGTQGALVAHGSYDVWSFGAVMYRLLARVPLVEGTDDNGSLLHEGITALEEWDDVALKKKLSNVPDERARNLLSHLLRPRPENRPTMEQVLRHEFFLPPNYMAQ